MPRKTSTIMLKLTYDDRRTPHIEVVEDADRRQVRISVEGIALDVEQLTSSKAIEVGEVTLECPCPGLKLSVLSYVDCLNCNHAWEFHDIDRGCEAQR